MRANMQPLPQCFCSAPCGIRHPRLLNCQELEIKTLPVPGHCFQLTPAPRCPEFVLPLRQNPASSAQSRAVMIKANSTSENQMPQVPESSMLLFDLFHIPASDAQQPCTASCFGSLCAQQQALGVAEDFCTDECTSEQHLCACR